MESGEGFAGRKYSRRARRMGTVRVPKSIYLAYEEGTVQLEVYI